MKDFYTLFVNELKDIYNAEHQIVQALPEMIKGASHESLKKALEHHLQETHHQIERLSQIGKEIKEDLSGTVCDAMQGLLKEGKKNLHAPYSPSVKDAAIIGSAQRVEHYEIAVYGTLRAYAHHFKLTKVEDLLNETLKEEGHANKKLTEIAEGSFFSSGVNKDACKEGR